MIDGLISGKFYGMVVECIGQSGKIFVMVKVCVVIGEGELLFVNVIMFSIIVVNVLFVFDDGDLVLLVGLLMLKVWMDKYGDV